MSGVPLETCWAFKKRWNNKFCYKAASCWYFYWVIYCYNAYIFYMGSVNAALHVTYSKFFLIIWTYIFHLLSSDFVFESLSAFLSKVLFHISETIESLLWDCSSVLCHLWVTSSFTYVVFLWAKDEFYVEYSLKEYIKENNRAIPRLPSIEM
jgi:hypothetical protein